MKQTKPARLFKKCPYEYYTFSCTKCPNYKNCTARIKAAQQKKQQLEQAQQQEQKKIHQKNFLKRILISLLVGGLALNSIIFIFLYKGAKEDIQALNENIAKFEALASTQSLEDSSASTENEKTDFAEISNSEDAFVEAQNLEDAVIESEEISEETIEVAQLSAYAPNNTYYYNVSDEDKLEMAKVVYAEAGAECFEGKVAVAAVILNRFHSGNVKDFGATSIYSVIHKKSQFASISHVTTAKLEEIPDCMEAVEAACKGWDPTRKTFSEGALYFYAPEGVTGKAAEDRKGIKVLTIGNHNFHVNFDKAS